MGRSRLYYVPLALFLSAFGFSEQCQIVSPLPVPVSITGCTFSGSLPDNSTSYIQNTLSPTTTTQSFSVQSGSVTDSFFVTGQRVCLKDGTNCPSAGAGDITAVTAGYGLTGGGASGDVTLTLSPTTTSYIQARESLQSGATFYVSSGTVSGQFRAGTLIGNGAGLTAITAANISAGTAGIDISGNAATATTATTATNANHATTADDLIPGDTDYVQIRQTLQSGATFYVSSGTVQNLNISTLQGVTPGLIAGTNITSITGTWPNQTINAATQSGGSGGSSLAVTTGTSSGFSTVASSPTSVMVGDNSQFSVKLLSATTAFISIAYSTYSATANMTLTSTHTFVNFNCSSACTATLPTSVGISGKVYHIKSTGTGAVTIATTSSQTIDGSLTITPNPNQQSNIEVISDGINWSIL